MFEGMVTGSNAAKKNEGQPTRRLDVAMGGDSWAAIKVTCKPPSSQEQESRPANNKSSGRALTTLNWTKQSARVCIVRKCANN
jgi:hypothetical protein